MSTLNSFIRSTSAAKKRAERVQQRRAKDAVRQYKIQMRDQEIVTGADALNKYTDYIDVLKSVHKDVSDSIDWFEISREQPPLPPAHSDHNEVQAMAKLNHYKPSFIDKVFGSSKKKLWKLEQSVEAAKEQDNADFQRRIDDYNKELVEWEKLKKIAKGILSKEITAYQEAIQFFEPFSEISELGSKLTLEVTQHNATINLHVNSKEIIPDYILSATKTGRLSKKNMSATKYNELYQDYVCSCVLRVARETLAYLPINLVVINAMAEIYNTATGSIKEEAIVSVAIDPATLNSLIFGLIDPSDSMRNFPHNMKFGKTTGFAAIEKIEAANLIK